MNDIIDRLRDSHRRRISEGYEFDKSINLLEQELKNNNIQENYISIIIEWQKAEKISKIKEYSM